MLLATFYAFLFSLVRLSFVLAERREKENSTRYLFQRYKTREILKRLDYIKQGGVNLKL